MLLKLYIKHQLVSGFEWRQKDLPGQHSIECGLVFCERKN